MPCKFFKSKCRLKLTVCLTMYLPMYNHEFRVVETCKPVTCPN